MRTVGAYYYPGWHACPVRDQAFPEGWREWDLLDNWQPGFPGHTPPDRPLRGPYDETDPRVMAEKILAAQAHGIHLFNMAFYWSRGKRLLQGALDNGLLPAITDTDFRFALMWANRMPRNVLPVKDPDAQLIDPTRLVQTDPDDFLEFIQYCAENYLSHPNYYRHDGGCYLSIFDTNFFLRQLGPELATQAIKTARRWLRESGFGRLHLVAIDPIPEFQPLLKGIGFDSVTHYVFLPDWKGETFQDFTGMSNKRIAQWNDYPEATGLPYWPSVSPGWDATPRGVDYGKPKPNRYPWHPIVTGTAPTAFGGFFKSAVDFVDSQSDEDRLIMIASWNEWTEGHCIEPGERFGYRWLEAIRSALDTAHTQY